MEEANPLAGNLILFQRTQKIQQQVTNNITTDTILATDNFNIYFSQAMNGIGPVLLGGQWVRISHNLVGYYIMYFQIL